MAVVQRTARDMALSMTVLLVPVVIIVALFRFFGHEDIQVTDPGPALSEARAARAFTVLEPTGLPSGWRPISSSFRREDAGATLRIGYLTPGGTGVQLIESSEPTETLVRRDLGGSLRPGGEVAVGTHTFQSARVREGEAALILMEPGRTVILLGPVSEDELAVLAASLH